MKWIDVKPSDWFYRDIMDADNIILEPGGAPGLVSSYPYNVFVPGKERFVKTYVSTADQVAFPVPGYTPSADNPLLFYVSGQPMQVAAVHPDGWTSDMGGSYPIPPPGTNYDAYLNLPVTGGLDVVGQALGTPELVDTGFGRKVPTTNGGMAYPSIDLTHKDKYHQDILNYSEVCVSLSKKMQRVEVEMYPGEDVHEILYRTIGTQQDRFAIVGGTLYTSFECNEIPCNITYYYSDNGNIYPHSEKVIPRSDNVIYNDRLFPHVQMSRAEFMYLLQKIRKNFYNRFTDRLYVPESNNERGITDIEMDRWYAFEVLDLLNEKYMDGCYVFPIYDDNTFEPHKPITRAETVTYLNRFIEWSIEKFR